MTTATKSSIQAAIDQYAKGFKAKTGIILGSGLSSLADDIEDPIKIPYEALPGVPKSSVEGHPGCFVLGKYHGKHIACMNGRLHYYEGTPNEAIKTLIRTFKVLGCEQLIITNAAGSLREDIPPGELMLINDHINFSFNNPLLGPNDDEFGPRFFPMENAYDPALGDTLKTIASELAIPLEEGVYLGVSGPQFETPAEIRAFRNMGADAVGMSTVPDVIIARHCDMRVVAISTSVNFGAGMSDEILSHEGTLRVGKLATGKLIQLVSTFIQRI